MKKLPDVQFIFTTSLIINMGILLMLTGTQNSIAAEKQAVNNQQSRSVTSRQNTTPGMRVYVDPETGEFVDPPSIKQGDSAQSTSAVDLVEEQSQVPGGGVMVDLKGRFQSPLVINRDAQGNTQILHSAPPVKSLEVE